MGAVNKSSIIRVIVLLLALGLVISERDWIRDAAYTLWVRFYSFFSQLWRW
jgi:hypothetical protein